MIKCKSVSPISKCGNKTQVITENNRTVHVRRKGGVWKCKGGKSYVVN